MMFVEAAYRFDTCQKFRIGDSNDNHSNIQLKGRRRQDDYDGDAGALVCDAAQPPNVGSAQSVPTKNPAD